LKASFPYITIWLLLCYQQTLGAIPVIFNEQNDHYTVRGKYIDYLEDPSNKLTISDISSPLFINKFKKGQKEDVVLTQNPASTYWAKITIINNFKTKKNLVFELYDFNIDYFELYIPDEGKYIIYKGGSKFLFSHKDYQHKNFIYDLPDSKGKPFTLYIKIKSTSPAAFIGAARTTQRLTEYATTEYFFLAIFYGIVIAMVLYNLFLYLALQDNTYLYYVLYVLSIGIFTLSQDGLGFQYLWPKHPFWNDYVAPISNYFVIICALLYTRSFLNTKVNAVLIDKGIVILMTLRTIVLFIEITNPSLENNIWFNFIPFTYIYLAGIICWVTGYRMARFYVIAFTLFFLGFSFSVLQHFNLIDANPTTVYSFNIGVLSQMILLSLALADRIKMLTHEKEKAQAETIVQLKVNEQLKDKVNKELEEKVAERTKELDNLVYRSSHDIKGPLKSIIGLTSIGLKDVKDRVALSYFGHILKSSKRLDTVLDYLLKVIQFKEAKLEMNEIVFENMVAQILSSLKNLPDFESLKRKIKIDQNGPFYSDHEIIYSVLQNLIENAIKYQDKEKEVSSLEINIQVDETSAHFIVTDNGLGIDKASQERVFDMFYQVNPDSSGSGLGLYMTKLSIEKLGGSMKINSTEGEGTSFDVFIKNFCEL
jgi:signal transduction histidine kinase